MKARLSESPVSGALERTLGGIESGKLSRESGDSNRAIPRSPLNIPKGPKIQKFEYRLKCSISLEVFNLGLQNSPEKVGVW